MHWIIKWHESTYVLFDQDGNEVCRYGNAVPWSVVADDAFKQAKEAGYPLTDEGFNLIGPDVFV